MIKEYRSEEYDWRKHWAGRERLTPRALYEHADKREEARFLRQYTAMSYLKGQRAIDIGCGIGLWCCWLETACLDVEILGVDQCASEKWDTGRVTFHQEMFRRNMFFDDSFAVALAFGSSEHTESGPGEMLREIWRILQPGGLAFVSTPYANIRQTIASYRKVGSPENRVFYQWRFTRAELQREMQIAGFRVREVTPFGKRVGLFRLTQRRWLRGLLQFVVPKWYIAHMIMAVGEKPE